MQIRCTGGGPPVKDKKEPADDLLYSIINEKTINGLLSKFGGDVDSDVEVDENRNISKSSSDIELIYEFAGNSYRELDLTSTVLPESDIIAEPQGAEEETSNKQIVQSWKKYKTADLQKPISAPLKKWSQPITGPQDLERNKKIIDNIEKTPTYHKKPKISRRRPAVTVKALTSSEVSSKYNKFLDVRLEIAELTKKKLDQEKDQAVEKHEKEMILLDYQIEVEKEKLKIFKKSDF